LNLLQPCAGFPHRGDFRFIDIPERQIPEEITDTMYTHLFAEQFPAHGPDTLEVFYWL